jgi:hypothetical protein
MSEPKNHPAAGKAVNEGGFSFGKYAPLFAWVTLGATLLFIPLKIVSYGYTPGGDARRHVGRAFTDRTFAQIVVMRPEFIVDHSPGWEWLLRVLHRGAGWDREQLMEFSVAALMLCVFLAPLPFLRRPEAWIAALLAQSVAIPEIMTRFSQARPFLFTEGVLMALLFAWSMGLEKTPSWLKLTLTTLGICLSVWIHGSWYLWLLPVVALVMSGQQRKAFWFFVCFCAGVCGGALLTGSPVHFLYQQVLMAKLVASEHLPQWMLVGEFKPSYGEFNSVLMVAAVLIWRKLSGRNVAEVLRNPAFNMFLMCWVLGFKADRFWADWGMPAALVWMTMQFEDLLPAFLPWASIQRAAACGLLALPLYLHCTNDLDRRYTICQTEFFVDAGDPALKGWMPGKAGIFYSAQMGFFYNTFYQNPTGDWRYIDGYEPALMPEEDLKILRKIQWNYYAFQAYKPWADKLRPEDRLEIESGARPNLTELEWTNAVGDIWIGRKPGSGGN